ncbi:MAG: hypothetical protein CMJ39_02120 [Phycisphaerae bacterium]|nr:hypothetical protein [Phycisphaerae bacterium]
MVSSPSRDAILPKWAGEAHVLIYGSNNMIYSSRCLLFALLSLTLIPILNGCGRPIGYGTDLTATSIDGEQWKVAVVITKYYNGRNARSQIMSAPTLTCRSGEIAQLEVGDGESNQDLIHVKVDTAKDPGTDEMIFTVMVRERGDLRSKTSFKVQPDSRTETAMVSDTGSK